MDRVRAELIGNPVQSGAMNRERLYQAGFNPPRADQMGGRRADRARAELNGNPVQSGGPNRERLYRAAAGRPGRARSRIMGGCRRTGRADRGLRWGSHNVFTNSMSSMMISKKSLWSLCSH